MKLEIETCLLLYNNKNTKNTVPLKRKLCFHDIIIKFLKMHFETVYLFL